MREQFTRIRFPQTLSEELGVLHAWQRSLVDFFLRMKIIDEQQAKHLLNVINNFPIDDYVNSFRLSWDRFMDISGLYEEMYNDRGLLESDDKEGVNEGSADKDGTRKKTN